jgi:hypothetical protein
VERVVGPRGEQRTMFGFDPVLSVARASGGAWLAASVERLREVDSIPRQPLLRGGLWRQFAQIVVSVSALSRAVVRPGRSASVYTVYLPDSIYTDTAGWSHFSRPRTFGDSGSASRTRLWPELEARVAWSAGRLGLVATAGTRAAVDSMPRARWGSASATLQVTRRFALIASAGREPARLGWGIPQGRFAVLGLRWNPVPDPPARLPTAAGAAVATFDVKGAGAGAGLYTVTMRLPRALTVELSGDFNGWKPIKLSEVQPGVWEASIALAPGAHRMNVRVNGVAWTAPPGTPTVADEFNGTVGLVVVP